MSFVDGLSIFLSLKLLALNFTECWAGFYPDILLPFPWVQRHCLFLVLLSLVLHWISTADGQSGLKVCRCWWKYQKQVSVLEHYIAQRFVCSVKVYCHLIMGPGCCIVYSHGVTYPTIFFWSNKLWIDITDPIMTYITIENYSHSHWMVYA